MARILKSRSRIFLASLVSFILGVALCLWLQPQIDFVRLQITCLGGGALLILITILWRKDIYIRLAALVLALFAFGFIFCQAYFNFLLSDPFFNEKTEANFQGYICNYPEVSLDSVKYEVCLLQISPKDKFKRQNFKILITVDLYPRYKYGQIVSGRGEILRPPKFEDFNYKSYLLSQKIFAVSYRPEVKTDPDAFVTDEQIGFKYYYYKIYSVLFTIRDKFKNSINSILSEPYASFLEGLLLGEKKGMSAELMDKFNATGLTHIIALSGFNVTIIIFAVATAFAFLGRKESFFISFGLVIAFVVMTGASSSVVRASIMVMLVLLAPLLGRKSKPINILILTAFVMVIINPLILRYDLGFALSFLAVSGLILLSGILLQRFEKSKIKKAPEAVKSSLAETLSAQMFAFPLILYSFGRVSIIAPITNVLILPFIPLTMLLGFLAAVLGMIWQGLGEVAAYFCFFFLKYMIMVVELTSKLPFASIEINKFPAALMIVLYFLLAFIFIYIKKRIKRSNGKPARY